MKSDFIINTGSKYASSRMWSDPSQLNDFSKGSLILKYINEGGLVFYVNTVVMVCPSSKTINPLVDRFPP